MVKCALPFDANASLWPSPAAAWPRTTPIRLEGSPVESTSCRWPGGKRAIQRRSDIWRTAYMAHFCWTKPWTWTIYLICIVHCNLKTCDVKGTLELRLHGVVPCASSRAQTSVVSLEWWSDITTLWDWHKYHNKWFVTISVHFKVLVDQ